ncbi:MAG: ATP-grasp domain-containing protein [Acidimicrobiia bacterium]|nr:ATP-grasp domain-containing protein [Acidimicrobiia bacterium]
MADSVTAGTVIASKTWFEGCDYRAAVPAVVFVAPYFLPTTSRFIAAAATTPGVVLGLVSADPAQKIPNEVRPHLAAHYQVENALDPDQLHKAVTAIAGQLGGVDRILGPLEELQVPMAQVRVALSVDGVDVETARNFRDKDRMKKVLSAHGLPCARHRLVGSTDAAWEFINAIGLPVVAKPPSGSGTRNTFRLNEPGQVESWLRWSPPSMENPTLLEEFVTGDEHAFDCVFVKGQPVWWNISNYYPTPLQVMENAWIQWSVVLPRDISGPEYAQISEAGPAAITALGLQTGLVHMEWFRRPDGSIAISEAAVRPPGAQFSTLISYAHDFDLYRDWAKLMIYQEFDPPPRQYAVGAAYLRGQGKGQVVGISGLEKAQETAAGMVVEIKLPETGQSPTGHYEGEGYVIVRHPETARVEEAIRAIVANVKVALG